MTTRNALLALAAACALSGCQTSAPMRLVAGLDTSGSARPHLPAYAGLIAALGERMRPQDRMLLFRVDREATPFRDGQACTDAETMLRLLGRVATPKARKGGTFPAAFFDRAADAAAGDSLPCVVLLATDGGNDAGAAGRRAMRQAARRLAKNPNVRGVVVWGVLPGCWQATADDLSPLGSRLHLFGPTEADAVEAVAALMTQARYQKRKVH